MIFVERSGRKRIRSAGGSGPRQLSPPYAARNSMVFSLDFNEWAVFNILLDSQQAINCTSTDNQARSNEEKCKKTCKNANPETNELASVKIHT